MTDGMRTSEFWVSLVVIVGGTVLAAIGKLTPEWTALATGTTGAYAVARGLAKRGQKENGSL